MQQKGIFILGLSMAIHHSAKIKDLVDVGMEKGFLGSDEINDFLPREIFSPEDVEDVFDFLSESDIDIVETIQEKVGPRKEESTDGGEVERLPSETTDNIIWAYLKDMGHVSLLTSDEEYRIAKKIEEADKKAKNILFELPQAVNELLEIGQQLKEETVNIVDVINTIDEMNCTQKDEEKHKKKTISSINTIKRLHEKKEGIKKILPGTDKAAGRSLPMISRRSRTRQKKSCLISNSTRRFL